MAEIIVFMGPPGAGKSVQAAYLAERRGYVHISTGDLLRHDATEVAKMAAGELVPSVEVEQILGRAVEAVPPAQTIVMDGFPRLLDEAEWLDAQLGTWQRTIRAIIVFKVDMATSRQRIVARNRTDDTEEALALRWRDYHLETEPVIEHYRAVGLLHEVDGSGSVEDVFEELKGLLS